MYKFLIIIISIVGLACNEKREKEALVSTWEYQAFNHNANLDDNCKPLFFQFQELYKGAMNMDTNYIDTITKSTIHLTDSLAAINLKVDTNLKKVWQDGMVNINAELKGLLATNVYENPAEFYMSLHMCNLQLLNLLGHIGYQVHNVYIFNSISDNNEDGYTWLSIQKTSRDPFKPNLHTLVQATQMLQEKK